MRVYEIILIAIALSIDAFSITIANCTSYGKTITKKNQWQMPVLFAVFQFLMPLIGYFIGRIFAEYISSFSGYLTAAIFFILAVKIILDNLTKKEEKTSNYNFLLVLIQAVATSIDALMIGVTFAVELTFSIFIACSIIGAITFIIVVLALFLGKYLEKLFGKYAEWIGVIILFALAVKSLIEAIIG